MGRAIVRDPQVFLFDEPLSNLDAKLRVAMRTEIKELHQRLKTTTVYVTHDQIEAMTMADKIVVMHDGIVEQMGAPLELYDRPANQFVAGFIGSPAMNFIEGRCRSAARRRRNRERHPAAAGIGAAGAGDGRWSMACAPNISSAPTTAWSPRSWWSSRRARKPRWWRASERGDHRGVPRSPGGAAGREHPAAAARSAVHLFDKDTGKRL